jgi:hypothetical protein
MEWDIDLIMLRNFSNIFYDDYLARYMESKCLTVKCNELYCGYFSYSMLASLVIENQGH